MDCSIEPDGFDYQGFVIRPPSEAHSILIQVTLGCSHNKCTFCGTYKDKRFAIKSDDIILRDLTFAQKHCRRQDRVFLMDGDVMVIPQKRLVWISGKNPRDAALGKTRGRVRQQQKREDEVGRGPAST
jgi:radical SAM superfamily enzyme YgiQ (UPF0313 family)